MLTPAAQRTFLGLSLMALGAFVSGACTVDTPDVPLGTGSQGSGGDELDPVGSTGSGNSPNNPPQGEECPYTGAPPIDPASLPACPNCTAGGAHCVPSSLVPDEFQADLDTCDATSHCVPDMFIETNGLFIAESCESVAGAEGRCLSPCIPQVAEQAANLPQSTCEATELCVPCYDPQTGDATGACELSCDPGPSAPPATLPSCCDGFGTCVPASAAGSQADRLGPDSCPQEGGELLCAPNEYVADPNYQAPDCEDGFRAFVFGEEYGPGKCLSECIPEVADAPLTGSGDCEAENVKCVPCISPLDGESTGACDQ